MAGPLTGKVALVAGATRGAGRAIAVELARAGATVYATGRSTRSSPSEYQRPETIEETGELMAVDTHLVTSHHALPLLVRRPGGLVVEMTDGTASTAAPRTPGATWSRSRTPASHPTPTPTADAPKEGTWTPTTCGRSSPATTGRC